MTYRLITAQTEWAFELAELKAHTEISGTNDDAYLQEQIYGVQKQIEEDYDLCLNEATYDLLLDKFPSKTIEIWLWPVKSVTSVKYTDGNGDTQTVSDSYYATELYGKPARIAPLESYTWPDTRVVPGAVQVRFTTGFISPEVIPQDIIQAMYLIIKDRFDNREDKGRRFARISERILTKYKYR